MIPPGLFEPDPLQAIEARVERARERLELLRVIEARLLSAVEKLRRVRASRRGDGRLETMRGESNLGHGG